jgi:hypothetical protein
MTKVTNYKIQDKDIFVLDDVLTRGEIENLYENSIHYQYIPDSPSNHSPEFNVKMVCYINDYQFQRLDLENIIQRVANILEIDFGVMNSYVNYYGMMHRTVRHCDTYVPNNYTMLIFPNTFWSEEWGGELKFHNDFEQANLTFDVIPGRIVLFDGRIEHTIMQLTPYAKRDRLSIAVKSAINEESGNEGLRQIKYDRNISGGDSDE